MRNKLDKFGYRTYIVSIDDARVLARCIDMATKEYGWVDVERTKSDLLNTLRYERPDGTVRLWKAELESAMWCAGMLADDGLLPAPEYDGLVARCIPHGKHMSPVFFTIEDRSNV